MLPGACARPSATTGRPRRSSPPPSAPLPPLDRPMRGVGLRDWERKEGSRVGFNGETRRSGVGTRKLREDVGKRPAPLGFDYSASMRLGRGPFVRGLCDM
jgi:hypothetical protein